MNSLLPEELAQPAPTSAATRIIKRSSFDMGRTTVFFVFLHVLGSQLPGWGDGLAAYGWWIRARKKRLGSVLRLRLV